MSKKDKTEEKEKINEEVVTEETTDIEEKVELTEEEKEQIESDRYLRLYSEFENFRKRTLS